jgi:hypothetical protein
MSGLLGILVPVLNAGVYTPPLWTPSIFNDNENTVGFTLSSTPFAFNLTQAPQGF